MSRSAPELTADQEAQLVLGCDAGLEDRLRRFRAVCAVMCMVFAPLWIVVILFQLQWLFGLTALVLVISGVLLAIATVLRHLVRVELLLDRERHQLLLRRQLLFYRDVVPASSLEELHGVAAVGELPQAPVTFWWDHVALILTRDGKRYRAGRHGENFAAAYHEARRLANLLDIEYLGGEAERVVDITPGANGLGLKFRKVPVRLLDLCLVVFWALFILFGAPAALYGLSTFE
ncbi:MAG: hypothetical protein HY319_21310 [Armatimonadetes bacterium]|nr:hypothetical protein [Armatimonadota bacterium]